MMESNDIYNHVEKAYLKVQNRWMNFHLRLLPICTAFLSIVEVIMFFVIIKTDSLLHSYQEYFVLYILFPVSMGIIISLLGYYFIKKTSFSTVKKQYIISYLFMLFAFVVAWIHGGFIVALLTVNFPILFTVMYEDHRLTSSLTIFGLFSIVFTAFSSTFDFDKVIDAYYIINLVICVLMTMITWLTSYFMIHFMTMKKSIIIDNDIQRYELRNQVMYDNLTGVGSRMALSNFMEIADKSNDEYCLVMMDIDKFKGINDYRGHLYGDYILKELGRLMKDRVLQANIYRYGGDEFVLIYSNTDFEIIKADFNSLFELANTHLNISLSAGAIVGKRIPVDKMIYCADKALYEAKMVSGSKLVLYQD